METELSLRTRMLNSLREVLRAPSIDAKLVTLTRGQYVQSWRAKIPPNHYQYPQPSLRRVQHEGINFELDISCLLEWCVYFGFKEESRDTLYSLVREGDTIIDIGANIGETLLNFSKLVGSKGFIFSFEPDPRNFEKCARNISLNTFNNLKLFEWGLGDQEGLLAISQIDSRNPGMNRILEKSVSTDTKQVRVTTLDNFVAKNNFSKIDLIKIDVEGYEKNVLIGATECIDRFKPTMFIEVDDNNLKKSGSSAKDLLSYVESKSYTIFNAHNLNPVRSSGDLKNIHIDAVCLPPGKSLKTALKL